jgi:YHS domain-containing protein
MMVALKEITVKKIALFVVIALAFSIAALGCMRGHRREMAQQTMQKTCPMTGNPIDMKYHSMYKSQCIYFCSQACKTAFDKMDDPDKAEVARKVNQQIMEQQKMQGGGSMPGGGM